PSGQQETEEFDYVVVATGHFSTPNMPYFKGLELFPGRVLHAHDFRDALEFADQNVLLVGASYSAEDIGSQCYKYGAKSVTISYRSNPIGFDWPEGMEERPLLTHVEGNIGHFADGSTKQFDSIVMCTGYLFHFPFLPDSLRLQTHNCLYPDNLYKGIFFQPNPKLIYLGMQDQYYTFNMFDAQAWYARDAIMGKITVPEADERLKDMQSWLARHEQLANCNESIDFQGSYIRDLLKPTDYPEFAVEEQAELFKLWLRHKEENIMTFRENIYPSTVTGTMATQLPASWLDIKGDSLESFMSLDFIESNSLDKFD
ncbi:MAG: NAD(P)-binding domain-containing protein, partial [Oceanisphaera sp.]